MLTTTTERAVLTARAHSGRTEHRGRVRAAIVLAAANGATNTAIAATLDLCVDTALRWRRQFATDRLDGLVGPASLLLPSSSSQRATAPVHRRADRGDHRDGLHSARRDRDTAVSLEQRRAGRRSRHPRHLETISPSTVRRMLTRAVINPWQHRSWIFPCAPDSETKAARVLDLYACTWHGVELGPEDYVISADEKSQLQALRWRHPGLAARTRPDPSGRVRVPPAVAGPDGVAEPSSGWDHVLTRAP